MCVCVLGVWTSPFIFLCVCRSLVGQKYYSVQLLIRTPPYFSWLAPFSITRVRRSMLVEGMLVLPWKLILFRACIHGTTVSIWQDFLSFFLSFIFPMLQQHLYFIMCFAFLTCCGVWTTMSPELAFCHRYWEWILKVYLQISIWSDLLQIFSRFWDFHSQNCNLFPSEMHVKTPLQKFKILSFIFKIYSQKTTKYSRCLKSCLNKCENQLDKQIVENKRQIMYLSLWFPRTV